jgi:hypothetical protein
MGHTVEALPELQTLAALYTGDERLRKAVRDMASGIIAKCTDGTGVKMGAQPDQLAPVPAASSSGRDAGRESR